MVVEERRLRPCPFCNSIALEVAPISFEKGIDEGYKPVCQCGWAQRRMHRWYSNRLKLIEDFNSLIVDVNFEEVEDIDE